MFVMYYVKFLPPDMRDLNIVREIVGRDVLFIIKVI